MASLKRGFPTGSPPPTLAAVVISLIILVKTLPRAASVFAFLCLMVAHLECPDIPFSLLFYNVLRDPDFRWKRNIGMMEKF
jgi:hypothetical protein